MRQPVSILDIGSSKVVCLAGVLRGTDALEVVGFGQAQYDGFNKGTFLNPISLEKAIITAVDEASKELGRKIKSVYCSVPATFTDVACSSAIVKIADDKEITADDERMAMELAKDFYVPERMQIIHQLTRFYELDGGRRVVDPTNLKANAIKGNFSFVMAQKQYIAFMTKTLDKLDLAIESFISESTAESLYVTDPQQRDNIMCIVDVGYYCTSIDIVEGDAIIAHWVLDVGGAHVVNDLMYGADLTNSEAEQLKKHYVFGLNVNDSESFEAIRSSDGRQKFVPREIVQTIIESRVYEIAEMVKETIDSLSVPLTNKSKIYLTGGGIAMMRGARDLFETVVGMPVEVSRKYTPKINTPNYLGALGMLDFAFNVEDDYKPENTKVSNKNSILDKILNKVRR